MRLNAIANLLVNGISDNKKGVLNTEYAPHNQKDKTMLKDKDVNKYKASALVHTYKKYTPAVTVIVVELTDKRSGKTDTYQCRTRMGNDYKPTLDIGEIYLKQDFKWAKDSALPFDKIGALAKAVETIDTYFGTIAKRVLKDVFGSYTAPYHDTHIHTDGEGDKQILKIGEKIITAQRENSSDRYKFYVLDCNDINSKWSLTAKEDFEDYEYERILKQIGFGNRLIESSRIKPTNGVSWLTFSEYRKKLYANEAIAHALK